MSLYRRLQSTVQLPGTEDFGAEIEAYLVSRGPGLAALMAHQSSASFDRGALEEVGFFFNRYRLLDELSEFHVLPPPPGGDEGEWMSMGAGLLRALREDELRPGIREYVEIIVAHRAGEVARFNAAAAKIRALAAEADPSYATYARYEVLFNRTQPFLVGLQLYLLALLLACAGWAGWTEPLRRVAYAAMLTALALHSAGLALRVVLQGRPPVTNLYSSAVFVGWVATVLGAFLEPRVRNGVAVVVASAIGFATLIIAHHLATEGDSMEMMRAVLDSNFWLSTHVVAVTIGYASTFLAGAVGVIYLVRGWATTTLNRETARDMARMVQGIVAFSLVLSFTGTVLGGIWADQSWGRFWGWDPKENGALLIVLWNAIILHARWGRLVADRGLMVMAVFGNILTSLSWFGVNMLGIGLHSYGFMDAAFLWLAAFVASQVLVMTLGAVPLERWRSGPWLT